MAAAAQLAAFPDAPRPWLDLSTGINTRPCPASAVPRAALARFRPVPARPELGRQSAIRQIGAAGILCRPFEDATRLRFGLPGSPQAWARLDAALGGTGR